MSTYYKKDTWHVRYQIQRAFLSSSLVGSNPHSLLLLLNLIIDFKLMRMSLVFPFLEGNGLKENNLWGWKSYWLGIFNLHNYALECLNVCQPINNIMLWNPLYHNSFHLGNHPLNFNNTKWMFTWKFMNTWAMQMISLPVVVNNEQVLSAWSVLLVLLCWRFNEFYLVSSISCLPLQFWCSPLHSVCSVLLITHVFQYGCLTTWSLRSLHMFALKNITYSGLISPCFS